MQSTLWRTRFCGYLGREPPATLVHSVEGSTCSSADILREDEDDVSGLLACIDVAVGFGCLLERIRAVDHGPVFAGLDELLYEQDVLLTHARWELEEDLLVAEALVNEPEDNVPESVGRDVGAAGFSECLHRRNE